MPAMTVYLIPRSPFRGRTLPRSDTLFGAICWGLRLLFGPTRVERFLHAYDHGLLPCVLSSMFPYRGSAAAKTHYFPKPLGDPYVLDPLMSDPPTREELTALRRLSAVSSVTGDVFSRIIMGAMPDPAVYQELLRSPVDAPEVGGQADVHAPLPEETAGVFFCVKYREENGQDLARDLKTVLYFLADRGIGGGISSGQGQFKGIEIVEGLPYQEPPDHESQHVVTLSLTVPDSGLRKVLSKSWYTLERRQGIVAAMAAAPAAAPLRKDHLLMLQEGSTFPKNGQLCYGALPVVRKAGEGVDFDVRQYGYAFPVNTKHAQR
ncbi:MAG: hypothetical protein JXL20_13915 [Deltaproteobacteria bacterium]|nr:hypothetical protein [Deltaproteobacteria bacterium]